MFSSSARLSRKIVGILFAFFLIAMTAIVLTLFISWQLEGVAAAINDAGSERMRTYRLSHLMAKAQEEQGERAAFSGALNDEVGRFARVLDDLQHGDPARPMASPRNPEVQRHLDLVVADWQGRMQPAILAYLASEGLDDRSAHLQRFDEALEDFVSKINDLVLVMESSYARDTNLLRTLQVVLAVLAVLGTGILIRFFNELVISPVATLHAGMRRMMGNDLSVRLPVHSNDELGSLAEGFNQMAAHLQHVYSTLEERVAAETRSLAERNRELGILYQATAFLSEPASTDVLCHGFLERIRTALGADAGAVRLYSAQSNRLHLISQDGLSGPAGVSLGTRECGECFCGPQRHCDNVLSLAVDLPDVSRQRSCMRDGFATATAFSIMHDKHRLGVFNLYFRQPHVLSDQERHLLDTLGQHLGVAIENLRLKSREKELAVSEERNLLAQELHDSIAQGLAFLNIQVQLLQDSLRKGKADEAMQTAGQLREGVQESYDDVRELLVHFRTRIHQADLASAIQAALEKFEGQTGIRTELACVGDGAPLEPGDEIQVMHIVQESLSNIRKHAQARQVRVSLRRQAGQLEVEVEDDGVGFDPVNEPNVLSDRHVGLKIMRERAHRVGGECRISSGAGAGTRVTLTLPREQAEG